MPVFVAFVVPGLSFVGFSVVFVAFVVFVGFWHLPEGLSLQIGLPGAPGPAPLLPGRPGPDSPLPPHVAAHKPTKPTKATKTIEKPTKHRQWPTNQQKQL